VGGGAGAGEKGGGGAPSLGGNLGNAGLQTGRDSDYGRGNRTVRRKIPFFTHPTIKNEISPGTKFSMQKLRKGTNQEEGIGWWLRVWGGGVCGWAIPSWLNLF